MVRPELDPSSWPVTLSILHCPGEPQWAWEKVWENPCKKVFKVKNIIEITCFIYEQLHTSDLLVSSSWQQAECNSLYLFIGEYKRSVGKVRYTFLKAEY